MNRTFAIALALPVVFLAACSSEQKPAAAAPQVVRNVSLMQVQRRNVPDILEAVGNVEASQTSELASQTMGNIVEMRAHEGERVQRGQTLAVIDQSQSRAALDRATASVAASQQQLAAAGTDLTLAESTLKRYLTLYEKKSVSPQEFDEIKARQQAALARRDMARADGEQATAALAQARTIFGYTTIRAPFDGIVTQKQADTGTLVSPGMVIFTVEDVRHYRLKVSVNESDLSLVRIGRLISVLIDAVGSDPLQGKVAEIVPAADPGSRSFQVRIDLPSNPQVRSGLFGRAQFSRGERPSLLIPRTAVVERGQLQGVFVLDQNQVASLHYVTLGEPHTADVEVLAGLEDGDRLVAEPRDLELDGKRIEAQR